MNILIIGDAILDEFIFCEPAKSSGGQSILRETARIERPGGALAVLWVALSLGADCRLFSVKPKKITRICCPGRQEIRIDRERPHSDSALPYVPYVRAVHDDIAHADAVILADYGKGALDAGERRRIIGVCRGLAVPCVVGAARGVDWSEYAGASILSATQEEAWAAGYPDRVPDGVYCLTADRHGLRIVSGDESHLARYEVAEVDPLGCGDSVVAALAVGLAEGMDRERLTQFAAAVGAVQARKGPGVQPVMRAEAEALIAGGVGVPIPTA